MAKLSSTHIYGDLYVDGTISGALSGNASTATTLQTARTINGTSFNGSSNITTANWGTARTITIGNTGKSVNGSGNVSWTLAEIGAAASSHSHNYAGSSSAGGAATSANKVNTNLVVKLNSGTTEGTNLFTFNGSAAKTINITPSAIGAAASSHGTHLTIGTGASNAAAGNHTHTSVLNQDTRAVNTTPNDVPVGLSVHLKTNGTDGLSDGETYHSSLFIKGWNDYSGGPYGNIAISANNNLWFRSSSSGTAWNAWKKVSLDGHTHSYAASSHTHNYAGSSSAGGAATSANKVNTNLVIKLNGGTTEGTNLFTFNGSAAKTVNITPSAIGAAASSHGTHLTIGTGASNAAAGNHTHSYLPLAGGTMTGKISGGAMTGTWVSAAGGSSFINSTAGAGNFHPMLSAKTTNGGMTLAFYQTGLQVGYLTKANIDAGTNTLAKNATLMDESGNGTWPGTVSAVTFTENGTTLTNKYAPKSHTHNYAASSHTHSYLPLAGGTMTGAITLNNNVSIKSKTSAAYTNTNTSASVASGTEVSLLSYNSSGNCHINSGAYDNYLNTGSLYLSSPNKIYLRTVNDGGHYIQINGSSVAHFTTSETAFTKNVYAKAGIKSGGNVVSDTAITDNLGTAALPWASAYADHFQIYGEASKQYGFVGAVTTGTTSDTGECRLSLGNATASGTASNAYGRIRLYGTSSGYTWLTPGNNSTSNITVTLPSAGGNLPIMSKGDTSYWGMLTPDGGTSWIRTTASGIIPSAQDATNGSGGIGTSSWPFASMYAKTFYGALSGNASTATKAGKLTTARTLTIGATGKTFDGSGNVSWSLQEIMKGQGLNAGTACGTLYFNNAGTSHVGRISCYNNADGDYVQVGLYNTSSSSVVSNIALHANFVKFNKYLILSQYIRPNSNGSIDMGASEYRWRTVYSANGVSTTSDRTLKENIKYVRMGETEIDYNDMYNFVKDDLELATYNYINSEERHINFIAQDLLVNEDGTDNKVGQFIINPVPVPSKEDIENGKPYPLLSYNTNIYTSVLAGALKESINKIEELENKNKKLEERLAILEEKFSVLENK